MEKTEERIIENYLSENGINKDDKTSGGIWYIEERAGTGSTPVRDDYVVINYVGRYLEDGAIHETNYDSLKTEWANSEKYGYFVYAPLKFRYGYSIPGINEGLSLMKEGGKARFIIPSDKAFYDFRPLEYEVELMKVIKDPGLWEEETLSSYLESENYDESTSYKTISFRETVTPNPSNTRTVQANDTIIIRYEGRYVTDYSGTVTDDIVFDSNMDDIVALKLVFGKNEIIKGSILSIPKGLITAIDSMRTGTHATAVLPYTEAFGTQGLLSGTYGYVIVPGYQTVVYDIILEDLRPPSGK
jgi:FKBP-type peptidyl-prolyl cis-trans isomerase